jgi:histone H3
MNIYENKTCKKSIRYFEIYISRILKNIDDEAGITLNAKQQLNSILFLIVKYITIKAKEITCFADKKTISEKEILNIIKLFVDDDYFSVINTEIDNCISLYNTRDKNKKYICRQEKAGIIFPPSICERILRTSEMLISKLASLYIAIFIENICKIILENSYKIMKDKDKFRITVRYLELAVRYENSLNYIFNKLNLNFLGGGVVPKIHDCLLVKSKKKKKDLPIDKKKHRFRPGTVCIREIKKLQKTNSLSFAKIRFEKYIRDIVKNIDDNKKISKDIFIVIQYYIEQFLVNFLKDANECAIHSGRVKLMSSDIYLMSKFRKFDLKKELEKET